MHRRYGGHLVLCNRHGSCSPQAHPENVITGQSLGRNGASLEVTCLPYTVDAEAMAACMLRATV